MPTKFPALEKAQNELQGLRKGLKDVFDEAGPDYDMGKVKSISGDTGAKLAWIREQNSQIEKAQEAVESLKSLHEIADSNLKEYVEKGADEETKQGFKSSNSGNLSLGESFIKSRAYKEFSGGQGPTAQLQDVNLKTLFQRTAGWDPEEVRSGVVVLDAQRPAPHVVDFLPSAPVSQSAYKYMEETTFTNNAAEAAEAAAYGEAALALTERSKTVEKIAVWIPVTDEQLEDEAGAEAYVNQRLTFMLRQRLDSQVLVGNGTTPNILGTENVSGISTQAKGTDSTVDALFKLFTTIRESAFSEPSVVFIRPSKWQEVVLMKTADGQYIWGHPSSTGPQTVWGVPVVQTTAVTSTKAVTGDYSTHSLLGIRRGIDMQVTNAHSDFFVNGKQAIRADMRCVLVHFRPEAFGTVTGL